MARKPTLAKQQLNKELDQADRDFQEFDSQVKSLTMDRMNEAPLLETEPQTKLSQRDLERSKELYLKPKRSIGHPAPFNEKFREAYNYSKERVCFIAENLEIIGEHITLWTKPYAGVPAEEWDVPVNTPVNGPRYLAEQIKGCRYHRMTMDENKITDTNGKTAFYGQMVVDNTIQRLDARPVDSSRKSVFMSV